MTIGQDLFDKEYWREEQRKAAAHQSFEAAILHQIRTFAANRTQTCLDADSACINLARHLAGNLQFYVKEG